MFVCLCVACLCMCVLLENQQSFPEQISSILPVEGVCLYRLGFRVHGLGAKASEIKAAILPSSINPS